MRVRESECLVGTPHIRIFHECSVVVPRATHARGRIDGLRGCHRGHVLPRAPAQHATHTHNLLVHINSPHTKLFTTQQSTTHTRGTHFLPSAIIPYNIPVKKINPLPNMLLSDVHRIMAGIEILQKSTHASTHFK